MSTWRRKALESFPSLRREIEDPATTVDQVFFELLPMAREAHAADDRETLKRVYDFAAWCARRKEQALWNAAGVSFYEHLIDHDITRNAIPETVPTDVFADVAGLLEDRMSDDAFRALLKAYDERNRTRHSANRPGRRQRRR